MTDGVMADVDWRARCLALAATYDAITELLELSPDDLERLGPLVAQAGRELANLADLVQVAEPLPLRQADLVELCQRHRALRERLGDERDRLRAAAADTAQQAGVLKAYGAPRPNGRSRFLDQQR